MQAIDRGYFRVCPYKIRIPQKPDTYDFSSLTRKEYLENPELFYTKPDRMPDFSIIKVNHIDGIEAVDISFPSLVQNKYKENNTAYGHYYKASGKKNFVTVIFLHGWGRNNLWNEKKIALGLARNNISCFILKLPFHFERSPESTWSGEYAITGDMSRTVEGARQLVIEVRAISSWLRNQGEKVVLSGMSLGGMMAHLAMAVEMFDSGITILTGGDNAGIIWEGIATKGVKEDIIKAGITREQARHVFQIIDPIVMAKYNKTKNVFMINGRYDEVVPMKFTMELWEALGRPKIRWYSCAHASIVIFTKNLVKDMVRFIRETL